MGVTKWDHPFYSPKVHDPKAGDGGWFYGSEKRFTSIGQKMKWDREKFQFTDGTGDPNRLEVS